jgi:hypothetical protein
MSGATDEARDKRAASAEQEVGGQESGEPAGTPLRTKKNKAPFPDAELPGSASGAQGRKKAKPTHNPHSLSDPLLTPGFPSGIPYMSDITTT